MEPASEPETSSEAVPSEIPIDEHPDVTHAWETESDLGDGRLTDETGEPEAPETPTWPPPPIETPGYRRCSGGRDSARW